MHTSVHQYILIYNLFQILVNKKHGKQNQKKVLNLQKAFSLHTIKGCRFKIIDGVKKNMLTNFFWGFAAVLWCLRQCVSCLWFDVDIIFGCFFSGVTSGELTEKHDHTVIPACTVSVSGTSDNIGMHSSHHSNQAIVLFSCISLLTILNYQRAYVLFQTHCYDIWLVLFSIILFTYVRLMLTKFAEGDIINVQTSLAQSPK